MKHEALLSAVHPRNIHKPFGRYSHGIQVAQPGTSGQGMRWLQTAGQLGVSKIGAIPEGIEDQAELCFRNLAEILAEAGMTFADVIRLGAYVTRREDFAPYMMVRDRYVGTPPPASTLLVVGGFTRPEMLVEVEAFAVARN